MSEASAFADILADVDRLAACEQCGECSSACPLTGVDGFNVRRILRHVELGLAGEIADTAQPWACTTCGRCDSVCPNGIGVLDIIRALRAVAPERAPAGPPVCVQACPGAIDIPGYLRFIARGEPDKAHALILEAVPFPGVLGRVCTHPCEDRCARGDVNQAVAICALKRYAADRAGELPEAALAVGADTGKSVAVVGAGPTGLTAAFYLRKRGHAVTVYEAMPKAGGLMRYGIPRYRLPEAVLDGEIERILGLGVELVTGARLGDGIELAQLREDHDAVFVAIGLSKSKRIDLPGVGAEGVFWGLDYLADVVAGDDAPLSAGHVVVIGGGDVAVDVALTALRSGAEKVTMACLESRAEMPAHEWEIGQAVEEGVEIRPSWGPKRIVERDGRAVGVELVRCTAVFDDGGAFAPTFSDETELVDADQVILAIGQTAETGVAGEVKSERGLLAVDPESGQTNVAGVFSGGEIATGPGALITAIAEGKKVAAAIDRHLGGDGKVVPTWADRPPVDDYDGTREKGFADRRRAELPVLPVAERLSSFAEVYQCVAADDAVAEAARCMSCDLERRLGKDR